MHVFIVYTHPDENSFTHCVLESFIRGIKESGHTYEISDLYKMNFRTDMSIAEYKRESSQDMSLTVPEDVKYEHEKMDRADIIVFIYPLWWSDCPAKLKGWFDRVYTYGYAYSDGHFESKIRIKKGLVVCSAGHTLEHLKEIGIEQGIRKIMLFDRLQNVGINDTQLIILGGTANKDKSVYEYNLERAYKLGKELVLKD
jgi:NAD(P)H dehydrogenase (quinone)